MFLCLSQIDTGLLPSLFKVLSCTKTTLGQMNQEPGNILTKACTDSIPFKKTTYQHKNE
jgi:hypothetical protein